MALWPLLWNLARSPAAALPLLPDCSAPETDIETARLQSHRWDIPVLQLEGSDYAMGWQQGRALRDSIRGLVQQFYQQFAQGLAATFYHRLLPGRLYHLWKAVPAPYRAELQGVADGAAMPLRDVLLINFFDDVLNLLELGWSSACTSVLLRGEGDRVLLGRNLDYTGPVGDLVRHFQVVLNRVPKRGRPTVSVAVAGQVGILTGMNDRGLSLGSMTAQTRERSWQGLGVSLLYRLLLDRCQTVTEAIASFQSFTPAQGNNLMLADPEWGARLEFTSRRCNVTHLENAPLAIANHYVDPALAATQTQLYHRTVAAASQERYQRLCQWGERHLTPTNLTAALTDWQLPPDDSRQELDFWRSGASVNGKGTLHSVVLDPSQRHLNIAIGLGESPIRVEDFAPYAPFGQVAVQQAID
jgi:hypothetical protein